MEKIKPITKTKVEMDNDGDIFVDGKKYSFDKSKMKKIGKDVHLDKHQYKEANDNERKEYLKTIINKLKTRTNVEELLNETLKDISLRDLKKISKRIKSKKPIQKQKGCLGFRIGDCHLQLFD